MDIGPLSHTPPIGPPNLPLVALLNSSMAPSQPSNGTYLILRENQSQGAQNTTLLTSLLSPSPPAHLLQLPHLAPLPTLGREPDTLLPQGLCTFCVSARKALPLNILGLYSKVTFPMGLSWLP